MYHYPSLTCLPFGSSFKVPSMRLSCGHAKKYSTSCFFPTTHLLFLVVGDFFIYLPCISKMVCIFCTSTFSVGFCYWCINHTSVSRSTIVFTPLDVNIFLTLLNVFSPFTVSLILMNAVQNIMKCNSCPVVNISCVMLTIIQWVNISCKLARQLPMVHLFWDIYIPMYILGQLV